MPVLEVDQYLISQVQQYAGGEHIHAAANLIGAYQSAVEQYRIERDKEFKEIARESERELRILLVKLKLGKAETWENRFGSDSF